MPAITSGTVLVTGANGFIGVWIIKSLLEDGFSVRAAVRSQSKTTHLRELFASFGDKLQFSIVEDITKDGAFDHAVQGVDAIAHAASPFHYDSDDPSEIIIPTVRGVTSILQSALKHGGSVKRIILLSSTASVAEVGPEPQTFTEKDWNNQAVQDVETNGRNANPVNKYCASKTLAERAGWEFYETHKAGLRWDFVSLNPPFVFGPFLHAVDAPEHLNTSLHEFFTIVLKGETDEKSLQAFTNNWVDVRDIMRALVLALKNTKAGGERLIVSTGPFNWYDLSLVARRLTPNVPTLPGSPPRYLVLVDTSKSSEILASSTRYTLDETLRDVLAGFQAKGWWGKQE